MATTPAEPPAEQLGLDLPPLGREVAAAVGPHRARRSVRGSGARSSAATTSVPARLRQNARVRWPPRDQLGHDAGGDAGWPTRRRAVARVDQRRVDQGDQPLAARRAVVGDLGDVEAAQRRGQPAGSPMVADENTNVGDDAVARAQPPEPAQQVGHVGAEHAAQHVELVDHDVAEPHEERGPAAVVREQPVVEHLGVGEHHVGVLAGPGALLGRGVAVVGGATRPGTARSPNARSWSWARALVGKRGSAVPGRIGSSTASAMGTW